jgi:hypothetical protein
MEGSLSAQWLAMLSRANVILVSDVSMMSLVTKDGD